VQLQRKKEKNNIDNQIPDGFTKWECPVRLDQMVEVIFEDSRRFIDQAWTFENAWLDDWAARDHIVAYRILKEVAKPEVVHAEMAKATGLTPLGEKEED